MNICYYFLNKAKVNIYRDFISYHFKYKYCKKKLLYKSIIILFLLFE